MGRLLSAKPLVAPSRQPLRATSLPTAPIAAKAQPVDVPDSTQRIAFFFALAMMFVRISILPEILAHVTHTNTFLLYIVSPPAILALLASGGIGRAYRAAPTWCWTGVFICMILSTPFSSWVGGSSARVIAYAKTDFICLLMFSGTVVRWSEIRKVASMLAAAGLMVVMIAKLWAKAGPDGRLALAFDGIISNPNDLAAHLVLLLPFVLLYAIAKGRNMVIRVVLFGAIGQGLWSILGTASRGAMISVAIMCAMLFIRGKASHRMLMMAGVPILLTGLIIAAPDRILLRLTTLFVSHAASEATARLPSKGSK